MEGMGKSGINILIARLMKNMQKEKNKEIVCSYVYSRDFKTLEKPL
jgi:hypothetical protein